jgi:hypothetical protein
MIESTLVLGGFWNPRAHETHFKIEHAKEEIYYLNIEIYRLVIYIRDKIVFLSTKEEDVRG